MRKALLSASLLALALPAAAHDTWIVPVRWSVSVGQPLAVDLTSAMGFPKPETAVRADRLVERRLRLAGVVSPLEPEAGTAGADALRLSAVPKDAGIATLWITTNPRTLELKPREVEAYLREIGAPETIGAAWRRSKDKTWLESYVKVAKTFVRVGEAADDSWKKPVLAPLELVPAEDPTALSSGRELALVLLSNGRPLADQAVGAVAAGAEPALARTDAEGRVRFALGRAGEWMFRATRIQPVEGRPGEWQSVFTTVTVLVRP